MRDDDREPTPEEQEQLDEAIGRVIEILERGTEEARAFAAAIQAETEIRDLERWYRL
jgi:hypothetical protein